MASMPIPKSVPKTLSSRIEDWSDERGIGNSLIVSLKDGWHWTVEGVGVHVRGFDNIKEAIADLRETAPCNCKTCVTSTGK
jgi:hypothetical protein